VHTLIDDGRLQGVGQTSQLAQSAACFAPPIRRALFRRQTSPSGYLSGSLLDVKRAATRNGDAVSSLMRTLTAGLNPRPEPFTPTGISTSPQKCLFFRRERTLRRSRVSRI